MATLFVEAHASMRLPKHWISPSSAELLTSKVHSVDESTQPFSRVDIERRWQAQEQGSAALDMAVPPDSTSTPDAPHNSSPADEVDSPILHPTSRVAQPPLHHAMEPRGPTPTAQDDLELAIDEEFFEADGRQFRVCLEALDHIGHGATPANMTGSRQSAQVCGSIGAGNAIDRTADIPEARAADLAIMHPSAPALPELPTFDPVVHQASSELDEDVTIEWRDPRKRRAILATLALFATLFAIGYLLIGLPFLNAESSPASAIQRQVSADSPSAASEGSTESGGEIVAETGTNAPPITRPERDPKKRSSKGNKKPVQCHSIEDDAEQARRFGRWAELEELARESQCWKPRSKATAMRMQALFELGKFDECVQIGANSKIEGVQKWKRTCQRALD